MIEYRKEIDGLRAIAVIPVLFFHAGFSGFSGGYVGVDVFFVISGYLITSILCADLENNTFSIVNFYERRARRILPALSFMLVTTTIVAYILLPANDLKEYSQSLISVVMFCSNIFFYLESGYFSGASEGMPLLHTWSLAVEEQYYLFFPILLWFLWKLSRRSLITVLVVLSLVSLGWSESLLKRHLVDANFYLIFSRAWELFVGSLLVFVSRQPLARIPKWASILSLLGLGLIVFSIINFDDKTPFPGLYALVPVIGTVLVIYCTQTGSLAWKLLCQPLMVGIGLISYSLYLWHQPIYAFIRVTHIGEPDLIAFLLGIFTSILMAYLSWRYVERPFRLKHKFSSKEVFFWSLICFSFFACIGIVGHVGKGFAQRFDLPDLSTGIQYSPKRDMCHTRGADYLEPASACRYFAEPVHWAVLGDSHVAEPAFALAKKLEKTGQGIVQLSFSGCPPALLFTHNAPGCNEWLKQSIELIESDNQIENVLIGYRYTSYLYGYQSASYPELPNLGPNSMFEYSSGQLGAVAARQLYWNSLESMIAKFVEAGKKVYLLYPIPELPAGISKITSPKSIFSNERMLPVHRATSAAYYMQRNVMALEKLDAIVNRYNLKSIKPFSVFCTTGGCASVIENKALYYDDNHLSLWGSKLLIDSMDIQ